MSRFYAPPSHCGPPAPVTRPQTSSSCRTSINRWPNRRTLARANVHPLRMRRARTALVAAAASIALVGGTFAATESFGQSPATTAAVGVPHEDALRTGTFETPNGEVLGQIVAYNGHPSWVYMNVGVSQSTGTVMCMLQTQQWLNRGSGHHRDPPRDGRVVQIHPGRHTPASGGATLHFHRRSLGVSHLRLSDHVRASGRVHQWRIESRISLHRANAIVYRTSNPYAGSCESSHKSDGRVRAKRGEGVTRWRIGRRATRNALVHG